MLLPWKFRLYFEPRQMNPSIRKRPFLRSISELADAKIFSIITRLGKIAELRSRLDLSTKVTNTVKLSTNIPSSADKLGMVQEHVKELYSNVTELSKTIEYKVHNKAVQIKKAINNITDEYID